MFAASLPPLAVVPIFVNAGAALLPALIAGVTSLVALLLSPRAMLSLCRRRPWLPVMLVGIVAGCYFFPRLLPASPAVNLAKAAKPIDWPGIARDILEQERAPHTILTPLWEHDLNGGMGLSTPVISTQPGHPDTLYAATTLRDVGTAYGMLLAIDTANGKAIWSATNDAGGQYLKPFFSSPAVSPGGKYLVVGQGLHEDRDCPLLCWRLDAPRDPDAAPPPAWAVPTPLHVESSPAIFSRGGELCAVVGAGAIEGKDRLPIGNPGYAFCVSLATGRELWQFPVNDAESSPAVDEDGIVYIGSGFNGNAVVALRSESSAALAGKPRFVLRTGTPFPAVGDVTLTDDPHLGKIILIGAGNGDYVYSDPHPAGIVLALDRATGKILWQAPLLDSVLGPLRVTPEHTLLTPCRDGNAYCLDLATGKILWHTRISLTPAIPVLAGLATDGPHAFALAADGTLAVLSAATGEIQQRLKLADEQKAPQNLSVSTPLYHNHTLYVATETTGLHAFQVGP